ncbi:MAG: DUF427 domain-containing protein [Anaerolinea sp.]|nr:DUF427 domain-containing protein [Anaerolinea sp.]
MYYTVKNRATGAVIAHAQEADGVQVFEGNLYFDPAYVDRTQLVITERTYTCPYKGTCNWIDLQSETGRVQNIGWIYPDPRPGYEHIKNRIAFYNRETSGTIVESER